MTLDDLPVEGKKVTWGYVGGVIAEALLLAAVGWVMLVAAAALDGVVR